jgi:glutathione peroxidase
MATIYDFTMNAPGNKTIPLSEYKNRVVLIVNVASECGFTYQYEGLEKLYQDYKAKGFTVLGFPCNQFGAQEPGTEEDIQKKVQSGKFGKKCMLDRGVTFPVLSRIDVNGDNAAPLYTYLKKASPGILGTEGIKWNFTKFLIGKDGAVLKRYAPATEPKDISEDIELALEGKPVK